MGTVGTKVILPPVAFILLALSSPAVVAGQQAAVLAEYDSVAVEVSMTWHSKTPGLNSADVASRLTTVFRLELRKDGVPVKRYGTDPSLNLEIVASTTSSGSLTYSSSARLVDRVVPLRDASRALADSTVPTAERSSVMSGKSLDAAVWVGHSEVATVGRLNAMKSLEARAREVAREFANAWLVAHRST